MINGTDDLDIVIESLNRILKVVQEEKWSITYAHDHASIVGKKIADGMSVDEMIEFSKAVKASTKESRENVDKVSRILGMTSEIYEHYADLVEIGVAWEPVMREKIDGQRYYQ